MELTPLIISLFGSAKNVEFVTYGFHVEMVGENFSSMFCHVEPHHTTEQARNVAEWKARIIASLLNEKLKSERS